MVKAARAFIANPKGFLSIHGNWGNGKTTALMAITNELLKKGVEARYMTAAELLAFLRETFGGTTQENDYDRMRSLSRLPVLLIDEMDKLRDTPYSRELQQELINIRYRDAREFGTVFAWNGKIDSIPWPAVVSRMKEYTVIENTDTDMRPLLKG